MNEQGHAQPTAATGSAPRGTQRARDRRGARPVVDGCMALVLLAQMLPGPLGNPLHELLGITFALLFVVHHLLNRGWLRRLGPARTLAGRLTFASDVVLTLCVALTALSGLALSRSALPALSVPALAHVARPLHGACSTLTLMTTAFHVGLHLRVMGGYVGLRARDARKGALPDVSGYDTVFVGCPIWWGYEPMVVRSFLDAVDLSGKTIVPFTTHAGSGLGSVPSNLQAAIPGACLLEGLAVVGTQVNDAREQVAGWVQGLALS